jgi:hypothetical protein
MLTLFTDTYAMGRPKGSKNRSTILREAQDTIVARGLMGREQESLDSLHVMEIGMRDFLTKAMTAKANKEKPEVVDESMLQAVSIAEKIAPYRHARLSAVKLAGDPNNPARFKDDATADELRAEVMRRLMVLQEAGAIDLQALPVPKGGIANQGAPGVDQSHLNGE